MIDIQTPYLLFLGDAPDQLAAKTARGIKDWRPENCVGQMSLENCHADLGLDELSLEEAWERGAKTLILGVANRGGIISDAWIAILDKALDLGYDIANGLHNKVADIPEIADKAAKLGRKIFDVRHAVGKFPIGNGAKRTGKRLLPLGTDCSCGKMYTALAFEKEMKARGMKADFRATGQTGILIAGSGVSVDAVISDFLGGVVETLTPENDADHWDLIEGQGSLFHPSFSGVTMGLIHGGQPDALVLCHEPTRTHMRGLPYYPIPSIDDLMMQGEMLAKLTNPNAKWVGFCINTSQMDPAEVDGYLKSLEDKYGLPAVDPYLHGTAKIVDTL